MQVHLLDGRDDAVGADEVRLDAGDVAVALRLLDGDRADQHVVLPGLDGDRAVGEAHPLAGARVALVLRALPALELVELRSYGVVALVGARARRHVEVEVRIGSGRVLGGRSERRQRDARDHHQRDQDPALGMRGSYHR